MNNYWPLALPSAWTPWKICWQLSSVTTPAGWRIQCEPREGYKVHSTSHIQMQFWGAASPIHLSVFSFSFCFLVGIQQAYLLCHTLLAIMFCFITILRVMEPVHHHGYKLLNCDPKLSFLLFNLFSPQLFFFPPHRSRSWSAPEVNAAHVSLPWVNHMTASIVDALMVPPLCLISLYVGDLV